MHAWATNNNSLARAGKFGPQSQQHRPGATDAHSLRVPGSPLSKATHQHFKAISDALSVALSPAMLDPYSCQPPQPHSHPRQSTNVCENFTAKILIQPGVIKVGVKSWKVVANPVTVSCQDVWGP